MNSNERLYKLELTDTDLTHVRFGLALRRRKKRELLDSAYGTKTKQILQRKITEIEALQHKIHKAVADPHVKQLEALVHRAQSAIAAIKNGELRDMSPCEKARLTASHGDCTFVIGEFAVRKI